MHLKYLSKTIVSLLIAMLMSQGGLQAQGLTQGQDRNGKLEGAIEDSTGVLVQGAVIEFVCTYEGRKLKRKINSNKDGLYEVELPVGIYQITIKYLGFRRFRRKDLNVIAGTVTRFNVILEFDPKKPQTLFMSKSKSADGRIWLLISALSPF